MYYIIENILNLLSGKGDGLKGSDIHLLDEEEEQVMTNEMHPVPDFPSEFDPTVSTEETIVAINKHSENSKKKQLIKLFGEEYLNKKTILTK